MGSKLVPASKCKAIGTIFSLGLAIPVIASWAHTGGGFELTRSTIDAGGTMLAVGGQYELSGTIGQPDAGHMAGGDFALTGGFCLEIASGDCDEDGASTMSDFAHMDTCLMGPGDAGPSGCTCTDFDGDGDTDLRDFAQFQLRFLGR